MRGRSSAHMHMCVCACVRDADGIVHRCRRAVLGKGKIRTLFINYSADARCVALNVRAGCRIQAVAGGMEP